MPIHAVDQWFELAHPIMRELGGAISKRASLRRGQDADGLRRHRGARHPQHPETRAGVVDR
jgi:hypothetical protein